MRRMVDDLLDLARTWLGDVLPISVSLQDAGRLCSNAHDEVSASFPQAIIEMCFDGDLSGNWKLGLAIGPLFASTNATNGEFVVAGRVHH